MKLRKIILTGLTLGWGLFANTLSETTSLIEKIKTVSPSERFELMNQIKRNILSLNQNDQITAIKRIRESRKNNRDANLATYKATLTPEKLVAFEEKHKLKEQARQARKARLKAFRDGLSDEQRREFDNSKKFKRKRITNKVQTSLSAEQLKELKQKKRNNRR